MSADVFELYRKVLQHRRTESNSVRASDIYRSRTVERISSFHAQFNLSGSKLNAEITKELLTLLWLAPDNLTYAELFNFVNAYRSLILSFGEKATTEDALPYLVAVAFGCGWRRSPSHTKVGLWLDALDELTLLVLDHVKSCIKEMRLKWGIQFIDFVDFALPDWESTARQNYYQIARQCALALIGDMPNAWKGSYGRYEAGIVRFTPKDFSSRANFGSQLRYCLIGGKSLQAKAFPNGLLWHALRAETASEGPPQDRTRDGRIRFTEQMALRHSAGSDEMPRSLELDSLGHPILDKNDVIKAAARIFEVIIHTEYPFWRIKSNDSFQPVYQAKTRPANGSLRPSNLWVRLPLERAQRVIQVDFASSH